MSPSIFFLLFGAVTCHCPHMMGVKMDKPAGPSAPGSLPDGDNGWDWDEAGAAPGILPEPHFVQSTYIYRSANELEKSFSNRVIHVLRDIRDRLGKSARLTLENENIECSSPSDHFRCQEFPTTGSWNYFLVEDEKNGAVVYHFERKNNEKNDGTIEMALLDALSRHSPNSLIAYASPEAEKEVGYIRALSTKELTALGKPPKLHPSLEKFGPNELNLIEPALLEVRTGSNLATESKSLKKLKTSAEFDTLLNDSKYVFILFWNMNRMVSLHTFNLWSDFGQNFRSKNTVLAHVACHETPDFCHGLNSEDFNTVVAYRDGVNIGRTGNIGEYEQWVELVTNENSVEVEELAEVKKGFWQGKRRQAVTIGVFRNSEDPNFKHYQIAAEKLSGRYYLAHHFNENSDPSINTYRFTEKQKRSTYSGRFDPVSILQFITSSSLPTIIDITDGFTTDLLLRQKRTILIQIGEDNEHFGKLATRQDARKLYNFVKIRREESTKKVLELLGVQENKDSIVVLNKDRIHLIDSSKPRCPDHLLKLIQISSTSEPDKVLSTKDAHPLRYLQVAKINDLFGFEESIVLPDHTLFLDADPFVKPTIPSNPTGGCPFMQGGGANADHDEL